MLDLNQFAWWRDHATKYIGTIITLISGALGLGLIPPAYTKYADFALAVLGGGAVKRGYTNQKVTNAAVQEAVAVATGMHPVIKPPEK